MLIGRAFLLFSGVLLLLGVLRTHILPENQSFRLMMIIGCIFFIMGVGLEFPFYPLMFPFAVYGICLQAVGLLLFGAGVFMSIRRLYNQARMDSLTGVYNRSWGQRRLTSYVKQAERYNEVLSIIFIDIDDLKRVNDTFGHQAGDQVIRVIIDIVQQNTRKNDMLIRYGGDEFILVLPGIYRQGADLLNARLQEIIARTQIIPGQRISFSSGVATYPEDGRSAEALIKQADQRMYQEKLMIDKCNHR